MRLHAFAITILLVTLSTALAEPATTQSAPTQPAVETRSEFIRFVPDGRGGGQLEVAVATYKNKDGQRVDLVSAVHVGESAYYRALDERLEAYDAVLYELIANADDEYHEASATTIQDWIARGLDLTFQDVDVNRDNFVHADLSREQMKRLADARATEFGTAFAGELRKGITLTWAQRMQQNAAGLDVMSAMLAPAPERARRLRRAFATILMLNERPLPGRYFAAGDEVLIGERNARAIDVCRQVLARGTRKLAILYGVGHMPDLERRLVQEDGFNLASIEWLTAWTVGPNPQPTTLPTTRVLK